MARVTGTQGSFKYDDTGAVQQTIAGVTSWTIDYVGSTSETTGMEDAGVKTFLPTTSEWSGSVEGHWETGNPPYINAAQDIMPGLAPADLELIAADGITTVTYTGKAICTGLSCNAGYDGTLDFTLSFQGSGALGIAYGETYGWKINRNGGGRYICCARRNGRDELEYRLRWRHGGDYWHGNGRDCRCKDIPSDYVGMVWLD